MHSNEQNSKKWNKKKRKKRVVKKSDTVRDVKLRSTVDDKRGKNIGVKSTIDAEQQKQKQQQQQQQQPQYEKGEFLNFELENEKLENWQDVDEDKEHVDSGDPILEKRKNVPKMVYSPMQWFRHRHLTLFLHNTEESDVNAVAKALMAKNYTKMQRSVNRLLHGPESLRARALEVASIEWQKQIVYLAIHWGDANVLLLVDELMRKVLNRPDKNGSLRMQLLFEAFRALHREGGREADMRALYDEQQTESFKSVPWNALLDVMLAGFDLETTAGQLQNDVDSARAQASTRAEDKYNELVVHFTQLCREREMPTGAAQSFLSDVRSVLLHIFLANEQFDRVMQILQKDSDPLAMDEHIIIIRKAADADGETEETLSPILRSHALGNCIYDFGNAMMEKKITTAIFDDICEMILFKISHDASFSRVLASLATVLSTNGQMAKFFEYMDRLVQEQAYEIGFSTAMDILGNLSAEGMMDSCYEMLCNMSRYGMRVNNSWFITMIKDLTMHGQKSQVPRVLDIMRQLDILPDINVLHSLIRSYLFTGDLENALNLKTNMLRDYGVMPDDEIYGKVVRMLIEHDQVELAMKQLQEMQAVYGMKPTDDVLKIVVDSLLRTGRVEEAHAFVEIHGNQLAVSKPKIFYNLTAAFLYKKKLDKAMQVFDLSKNLGALSRLDNAAKVFHMLIMNLTESKHQEQALTYLVDMVDMQLVPSRYLCNAVLHASINDSTAVEQVLSVMRHCGIRPDTKTYTSYMKHVLRSTNDVNVALQLFKDMEKHVGMYNLMIDALHKHDKVDEAWTLLQEMRQEAMEKEKGIGDSRLLPNAWSYRPFLQTYAIAHDNDGVRRTVDDMKTHNVQMDLQCYNALIRGYKKTGDEHQVLHWFDAMQLAGIKGDELTYNTVMLSLLKLGRTHQTIEMYKNTVKPNEYILGSTYKVLAAAYIKQSDMDGLKNTVIEMEAEEDGKIPQRERDTTLRTVSQWFRSKGLQNHLDELEREYGIIFPDPQQQQQVKTHEKPNRNQEQEKHGEEEKEQMKHEVKHDGHTEQRVSSQFPDDVLSGML